VSYLYAWNGERFEFVTELPGRREMGYWEGGQRNHPIREYTRIRADQLREKDGRYELRVTNELEEVLYPRSAPAPGRRASRRRPGSFPDEGMTEPPKPYRLSR